MIRYNAVYQESLAVQQMHWPDHSLSSSSNSSLVEFVPPMFLVQLSTNFFRKANRKDILEGYKKQDSSKAAPSLAPPKDCSSTTKEILPSEQPLALKLAQYTRGGLGSKNRFRLAKQGADRVEAELMASQAGFLPPAKEEEGAVEGECMVCLSSLANSVNYPCFHGGICEDCNKKVLEKSPPSCIICKQVDWGHQGGRGHHQD